MHPRLPIDKTAHRKALQPRLNGRSHGSIEFKHQNISAVLINFDQPYVKRLQASAELAAGAGV